MPVTNVLAEAERLITVCNSCRYCEGLCAVFPALEMRRAFPSGDINYLANLCHGCGACYYDCQFSPPHEFDVNIPRNFAQVRAQSYQAYAWPQALSGMFERNGLAIGFAAMMSVAVFIVGFVSYHDRAALFEAHSETGAFYRLMPHNAMVLAFGAAFLYSLVAIYGSVRLFWRDISDPREGFVKRASLWQACKDASRLRYLDGGGVGCMNEDERPMDNRKLFHHLTFYGFLLCFASTCVATLYHYILGRPAPYSWYGFPVVFGAVGGIGLLIGAGGLMIEKWRRDPMMKDQARFGMDIAFLAMLFLMALTGIALLAMRETAAMPLLLAIYLGFVFAFFITMPYGNFVHGIYRFVALVRYAQERPN